MTSLLICLKQLLIGQFALEPDPLSMCPVYLLYKLPLQIPIGSKSRQFRQ